MSSKYTDKKSMLEGSLWNKILGFAFPLALTGILQQLFNAADIAVVGNFAGDMGAVAMAAVGANTPLISFVVNSFLGISLGTNVIVANAIGRKDDKAVEKAVHTSMIVAVLGGVAVALLAQLLAEPILRSQNIDEGTVEYAILYFRIYMAGLPLILLYNFEAAVFRGMGNTKKPFAALIISGMVNVLLNIFFVMILHRTVDGVATATVISNLLSSIILLYFLKHSESPAKFGFKKLGVDGATLKSMLKIGIPAAIQAMVFSTANIIIQSAINSLGTLVMAASSAAFNIEIFSYYVLNSFGQACTTFTGQNYGARKFNRCRKSLKLCMCEGIFVEGIMVLTLILFGKQMIALFNPNPELVEIGYIRVVMITTAHLFSLFYDVMSGYMRGYGISLTPALVTMVTICGTRIVWIMTFFAHYHTFDSIMIIYPISLGLNSIAMFILLLIKRPAKKLSREAAKA